MSVTGASAAAGMPGTSPKPAGTAKANSASDTLFMASRTASLMRRQPLRVGHSDSTSQAPAPCSMQTVSAIGPSTALTMSAAVMAAGGRASR